MLQVKSPQHQRLSFNVFTSSYDNPVVSCAQVDSGSTSDNPRRCSGRFRCVKIFTMLTHGLWKSSLCFRVILLVTLIGVTLRYVIATLRTATSHCQRNERVTLSSRRVHHSLPAGFLVQNEAASGISGILIWLEDCRIPRRYINLKLGRQDNG